MADSTDYNLFQIREPIGQIISYAKASVNMEVKLNENKIDEETKQKMIAEEMSTFKRAKAAQQTDSAAEALGWVKMTHIFRHCQNQAQNGDATFPVVIDYGNLLSSPESYLRNFCDVIRVNFEDGMIGWSPDDHKGAINETSKLLGWHDTTSRSRGWNTYRPPPKFEDLPVGTQTMVKEVQKYYDQMYAYALTT